MKRKPAKYTPAKKIANARNTNKRQAAIEAKARREGWECGSAMITAWLRGDAVIIKVNGAGA